MVLTGTDAARFDDSGDEEDGRDGWMGDEAGSKRLIMMREGPLELPALGVIEH